MDIYVVQAGDTLTSIGEAYGVSAAELSETNRIPLETPLVVGQTVVVLTPDTSPKYTASVYGYAYTFIAPYLLRESLPFSTYLVPFTYGFTENGELVDLNDEELLALAEEYGVAPLMHLSTLTPTGGFNSELAGLALTNDEVRQNLIENTLSVIEEKGYSGLDIDFEFVPGELAESYASFVSDLRARLSPLGKIVIVALAPKTSADQPGLLYEGHNYALLGDAADYVLLMTYEWGYTYGPPLAVAPIPNVRRVLDFAVTQIPREKIYMGIPNYGYDFRLPYIQGESRAQSISNVRAVEIAREAGVDILFDEVSQSPYFSYTAADGTSHEVHFEDARSILAKLRLIEEYSLYGAGYWNWMRPFPQNFLVLGETFDIRRT